MYRVEHLVEKNCSYVFDLKIVLIISLLISEIQLRLYPALYITLNLFVLSSIGLQLVFMLNWSVKHFYLLLPHSQCPCVISWSYFSCPHHDDGQFILRASLGVWPYQFIPQGINSYLRHPSQDILPCTFKRTSSAARDK